MTIDAAFSIQLEKEVGSIEVGNREDIRGTNTSRW